MPSEPTSAPYRDGAGRAVAPLTVRYSPFLWSAPLSPLLVAAAAVWATDREIGAERLEHLAVATVFVLALVYAHFPLVTVQARVDGSTLTLTGSRWPGAIQTWTLSLEEAVSFDVGTTPDAKQKPFHVLLLKTGDGRALPLTASIYRGGLHQHASAVSRLNAWLEQARSAVSS